VSTIEVKRKVEEAQYRGTGGRMRLVNAKIQLVGLSLRTGCTPASGAPVLNDDIP